MNISIRSLRASDDTKVLVNQRDWLSFCLLFGLSPHERAWKSKLKFMAISFPLTLSYNLTSSLVIPICGPI